MKPLASITVMPIPVPRLPVDAPTQLRLVLQRLQRQGFSTEDIRHGCDLIDAAKDNL